MTEPSKRKHILFTADDAPISEPAGPWLDRLQKKIGGTRGYGGPRYFGHWLLCRPARRPNSVHTTKFS